MRTDRALYNILKKTGYANKEFFQRCYDKCGITGTMVVNPLKLTHEANELLYFYVTHNYLLLIETKKFKGGLLYYYKKVRD